MGIFKRGKGRKKGVSLGDEDENNYDDSPGLLEKNSNSTASGNTVDSFADFSQEFSPVKKVKSTRRGKSGKVVEEWKKNKSTGNINSLGHDFYNDPNMNFDSGGFDDMSADVSYLNDDISANVNDDESVLSTYIDEDDAGKNVSAESVSPMAALRKKQQAKKKTKDLQKKMVMQMSTLEEDDSDDEDDDSIRGETSDDGSSSSAEDNDEYESFFAYLDKEKTEEGSTEGKEKTEEGSTEGKEKTEEGSLEEKKPKSGKKKKKKKDKKKKGKIKKKGDASASASSLNDSASSLLNMVSPVVSERKVVEPELVNSSPEESKIPTPADLGYEIAKHGDANVADAARRAIRRSSVTGSSQPAAERKSRFDQILEGGDRPRYNRRRSLNIKLSESEIEEIEEKK
jgi:hypothetical protein